MIRKGRKSRTTSSNVAGAQGTLIRDDEMAAMLARRAVLLQRRRRRRVRTAASLVLVTLAGLTLTGAAWTNVDGDGDGISDCRERAGLHNGDATKAWETNPDDSDSDGDGVMDGEETTLRQPTSTVRAWIDLWSCSNQAYAALSDPTLPDTDKDGLDDAVELSDGSSPLTADSDDDGLSDAGERDWGSDPNAVDTDGDGFRDGDDVDEDFTPVEADERIAKKTWSLEYAEGVLLGEAKNVDSVPQLLGSMSGSSSSTIPFIGWVTGTIADLRDLTANSIRGEWVSAAASGAGILPYAGDAAKASKQVTKFIADNPTKVRATVKALADWDKLPTSVRVKLLQVTDQKAFDKLRDHELSDEEIVRFAKRGTQLATLVVILDKVGEHLVQGIPAANADSDGFATSIEDAENALREYAKDIDGSTGVASEPVYIGEFPEPSFSGGRLIDACTKCVPNPQPGKSTLRVAKVGSQPYFDSVQTQIDKDAFLANQGYAIEWHFYAGRTGLTIDPRVLDALDSAGIGYFVHLPS